MKELTGNLYKVFALAIVAAALTLFVACGGSSEEPDAAIGDSGDVPGEHSDSDHDADDENVVANDHVDVSGAGDEVVINMSAEDFKFKPEVVTIRVGQTVRLHLENQDPVIHDYSADEAEFIVLDASGANHDHGDGAVPDESNGDEHDEGDMPDADHDDGHEGSDALVSLEPLHIAAEANEHADLVFKAMEAGEYEFYCSVPGHREVGMIGTIVIVE